MRERHELRSRLVLRPEQRRLRGAMTTWPIDLLNVSRIERGKIELARKPLQLAEIVAKVVEIASPLLEERRHRRELDVPPSVLTVHGDETRLAQVAANLLTNAARYTDEGGRIEVRATRDANQVVLRVRDSGITAARDRSARRSA
jgi:signal transduction histidine kinase